MCIRDSLTTLQTGLDFIHLANPLTVDVLGDILFKFRVFYIFGIRVNRVYGRITLLVGTVLLKGIEACLLYTSNVRLDDLRFTIDITEIVNL